MVRWWCHMVAPRLAMGRGQEDGQERSGSEDGRQRTSACPFEWTCGDGGVSPT